MATNLKSYLRNRKSPNEGKTQNSKTQFLSLLIVVLVFLPVNSNQDYHHDWKTIVKWVCHQAPYPIRCVSSMAFNPAYRKPTLDILSTVAVQVSLQGAQNARDFAASLHNHTMDEKERAAWQDCVELFKDSVYRLNMNTINNDEAPIWLSTALANREACLNGFRDFNLTATSTIAALMSTTTLNLSEMLSNSLSMYSLSTWSLTNRHLLSTKDQQNGDLYSHYGSATEEEFPQWLGATERNLLQSSSLAAQANVVVAKDGSGNYRTIGEAVNAAPQQSSKRYVIYIKAGLYKENIDIPSQKTNLMFIGEGRDKTVVTGSKSVADGVTTFKTATVGVSGDGFIARDMTFENTAGPEKHQAVALRIGSDRSVVHRCSIKGYQDTLYVFSFCQFYSEVDIYGTVDFIFGYAAVVIQNSNIIARRPLDHQGNTITAHGRSDPNERSGISIHNCRISAAPDLQRVKGSINTYLGRPWGKYARVVVMQSVVGDLIAPAGWSEFEGNLAPSTLYYGEYMNSGAGAATSGRVNWPGYHVITSASEASKFTVGQFISGDGWIPATGVRYTSGLK
ncbi:hypothetical protein SUGI_0216170 [Cryptomeria japonica]|uniref:pectinesterase-like n=1 Tax=Cryptomeria japonica TaxID=3369 RepID=UPI002408AC4C|nr:pectinesterase-like [Cryptomeria japonica]GLJ13603.1 hypothetical protein SUGI_0216170 [Cryptomeria japonica]